MVSSRSSRVACSQRWLSLIAVPACRCRAGKAKAWQCPWRAAQARKPRVLSDALALAVVSHSSMSAWRHCRSVVPAFAEPGQEPGGFADRVPGAGGAGPVTRPGLGVLPEPAHDLPGGERADETPVLRDVQGFQQAGEPLPGAGEFLVAGREDAAGGEHLPEEPGGAGPRVRVERLVGGGGPAGRDVGEDGGAGAVAQPVQRGARVAGRADRLEHGAHRRGDVPGPARQEPRGALPQAAPGAQSLFVELVLGAAAGAGGHDGQPGAVRAGDGVRPGREDQAPVLAAARAPGPAAERGRVAGVADRAFGPSCLPAAGPARSGRTGRSPSASTTGRRGRPLPAKLQGRFLPQPLQTAAGSR